MTTRPQANPRTHWRAFRDASQFGVLYSSASTTVYPDLVDGPYSLAEAEARRIAAERTGVQAVIVASLVGPFGVLDWLDIEGRTAEQALRDWIGVAFTTDGALPRLDAPEPTTGVTA